jgi:hypothetical protein
MCVQRTPPKPARGAPIPRSRACGNSPRLQRVGMGRTQKQPSERYVFSFFFPFCLDLKMFKSKNCSNLKMFRFENSRFQIFSKLKNVQAKKSSNFTNWRNLKNVQI